jgi:hypothetical protein
MGLTRFSFLFGNALAAGPIPVDLLGRTAAVETSPGPRVDVVSIEGVTVGEELRHQDFAPQQLEADRRLVAEFITA